MKALDLDKLIHFRRILHQYPEVSGQEFETANRVEGFFKNLKHDRILTGLGGTGVAVVYEGTETGPTSLFRCELDGLPIPEEGNLEYVSRKPGVSHVCGHDGHMAIITGLGMLMAAQSPKRGKVVLLFQPAEETGDGARAVLQDPNFEAIKPDYAFALHNLPGFPLHQIVLKAGTFAAASVGMKVKLKGRNAHSAHPEAGNSPALAMAEIISLFENLPKVLEEFTLVTVVHAKLGEINFGTTPGEAMICATLRAFRNETRDRLVELAEQKAKEVADSYNLGVSFSYTESFAASHNHQEAYHLGLKASGNLNFPVRIIDHPFRWSEDFGLFSDHTKTLLFGLGSGEQQPQLHEPHFDFPDALIETGVQMFAEIIQALHA
jgi:amidohydrolase